MRLRTCPVSTRLCPSTWHSSSTRARLLQNGFTQTCSLDSFTLLINFFCLNVSASMKNGKRAGSAVIQTCGSTLVIIQCALSGITHLSLSRPFHEAGGGAMMSISSLRTGWMKRISCEWRQIPPSGFERGAPYLRSPLITQPIPDSWQRI